MKRLIPLLCALLFLAFPGCKKATAIERKEVSPTSPEVTVNIYVDGKIAVTQKSNWAKGVTSADYIVQ